MIVITGAAGFISSCLVAHLNELGYKELVLVDDFSRPEKKANYENKTFLKLVDRKNFINWLDDNQRFTQFVIHLGARTDTTEFNKDLFDELNLNYSKNVWNKCVEHSLPLIYASSAATYGLGEHGYEDNHEIPINLKPLNPYAKSKLKIENYLIKNSKFKKFKYIILRYFNVAGADKKLRTGLISKSSTNLIKAICEVAIGKRKTFKINGNDYNTKDGTPIRDFIHVNDLAEIHYLAGKYLLKNNKSHILNCGYGKGYSVLEVVKNINLILTKKIPIVFGKRRYKDIKTSIANTKKFNKYIKWKPKYNSLRYILKSSYEWEKKSKTIKNN